MNSLIEGGVVQPELNGSLFDSWMLSNFPGRTLEELDGMDILRFMRAIEARSIESTERLNTDILSKKIKPTEVEDSVWKRILENNEMWEDYKRKHGRHYSANPNSKK